MEGVPIGADRDPFENLISSFFQVVALRANRVPLRRLSTFIGLGRQEVKLLQARRMAAGGTDQVHSAEGIIEVNYGLRLHRGIRLNPNIQYVVTPDNIAMPNAVHQSRSIMAFGLRLTIDAATLAGLPIWQ